MIGRTLAWVEELKRVIGISEPFWETAGALDSPAARRIGRIPEAVQEMASVAGSTV